MPLDPAILKIRWGISDDSKDPLVEQVAAQAQALAETYTGRRFDLGTDAQDFERVNYSLQVRRYPIVSIEKMHDWLAGQMPALPDEGSPIASYRLDKDKGLIWVATRSGVVHVEWTGGYEDWPPDLDWAITQLADIIWSDTPGGGAAAGSGGGTALGQVKKLSVVGVYSVEVGGTDSSSEGGGSEGWGVITPPIAVVLDRYSIAAVVGIG